MDRWSNASYMKRKESELRSARRNLNTLEEAFNNLDPTEEEMIDDPEIDIYAKEKICDKKERQLKRAMASRVTFGMWYYDDQGDKRYRTEDSKIIERGLRNILKLQTDQKSKELS